ncbi:MAG: hypothetical protein O3B01_24085 [Planctomycetota bacterium]|nr:hypothetical protein [Planctomycetota bacterium]
MEYLIFILFLLAFFWILQFVQLMLLSNEDFVGRHDKILWVVIFICVFPLAPFAFVMYKIARLSMNERD